MKLNKKEKNYLLSTLFKGYVIQCAICSVLIFGGTFLEVPLRFATHHAVK